MWEAVWPSDTLVLLQPPPWKSYAERYQSRSRSRIQPIPIITLIIIVKPNQVIARPFVMIFDDSCHCESLVNGVSSYPKRNLTKS